MSSDPLDAILRYEDELKAVDGYTCRNCPCYFVMPHGDEPKYCPNCGKEIRCVKVDDLEEE